MSDECTCADCQRGRSLADRDERMEYLEAVNQALAASNASLEASHRRQAATILQMQADAPAVREMENDGDRFDALRRLVDIFDAWGDVETLLRVLAAYYGVK